MSETCPKCLRPFAYCNCQKYRQTEEGCNSIALAEDFLVYVKANPSLRFWQALRNWAGVNFIFAAQFIKLETGEPLAPLDTFYWETRSPLYPKNNGR